MATILFDICPATGHYNGSYKLARLLKEKGHRIVYFSNKEFDEKIKNFGFESLSLELFDLDGRMISEYRNNTFPKFLYNLLNYLFSDLKIVHSNLFILYDKLISFLRPDIIILDYNQVEKTVIYYKYDIQIITIETALAADKDTLIPPLNSRLVPRNTLFHKYYVEWLWFITRNKHYFKILYSKFVGCGQDSFSAVKNLAKISGFPFKKRLDFNHYRKYTFRMDHEIITSARDLDFPRPQKKNQYYVGPLIDFERETSFMEDRYFHIVNRLQNDSNRQILVYCSFGSVTGLHIRNCRKFYKKLINVCKNNPRYLIMLSVGTYFNINDLPLTPDNMYIFQTLPQLDILRRCDLMITHGGTNSIMECVYSLVPMLVYPYHNTIDWGGNSARVVFHGLGERGKLKFDSPSLVAKRIGKVYSNRNFYKKNLEIMREKFEAKNNSTEAAEIVEKLIKCN